MHHTDITKSVVYFYPHKSKVAQLHCLNKQEWNQFVQSWALWPDMGIRLALLEDENTIKKEEEEEEKKQSFFSFIIIFIFIVITVLM